MPGMPQLECRKLWPKSQATAKIGCCLVAFHSRKWSGLLLRLPHALPTFCRSTACVSQALCRPRLRPCDIVAGSRGSRAWGSGGLTRCVEQETKAVSATPPSIAIEALVLGGMRVVLSYRSNSKKGVVLRHDRRGGARAESTPSLSAEKTWRGSSMSVIRIL
jgi:hypothetical protein